MNNQKNQVGEQYCTQYDHHDVDTRPGIFRLKVVTEVLSRIGLNPQQYQGQRVFRGKGCDHCLHTGYRGRRGIFELLSMSPAMKSLVLTTADANEIHQQAMAEGMVSLAEDGADKVLQGLTTIEEVYRVCRQG